ncbi:MAG: transposase, partial [Nitrospirae bacterium]
MEKIDARTLNQDAQYQIRRQVVKLRQKGMKYREIAEVVGISLNHAMKIYKQYERHGWEGISKGQRGRRPEEQKTLQSEQEATIRKEIQDKTPDQLKMPFALWTRKAVQELIRIKHGIKMPIRTVGEYLKRWGFTAQ